MIRAGVSWWPGNVSTKGGTHIHHMVWGIVALLVTGFCSLALDPGSPWRELLAVLFGIGAGLTLDEFALWVNLEDVYWAPKGRESIDAVIVAAVLVGLVLLGVRVWVDLGDDVASAVAAAGVVGLALAVVNLLKGKLVMATASLVAAPVGLLGALRLARPESPWARLYGAQRRERARQRFPEPWLPAWIGRRREPGESEPAASEPPELERQPG
jgi:hypothetical protein